MTTDSDSPHSVHALVRLLKSAADPPSLLGPSKIEIASHAWSDSSFRAANKGEIIGEWILTLLGQAKKTKQEKGVDAPPFADSRYWTLLGTVLTAPPPTVARPIKTWLLPLLGRLQLDTIVIELLALRSSEVLAPAQVALAVLWPMAEKKIGIDALAECLSAVFNACTDWERVDNNLTWICSAIVASYRYALTNAGNKKKLYNVFLSTHLPSWLCSISHTSISSTRQLQDNIYAAGTDTLFSLDALKQPLDTLFEALSLSVSSALPVLSNLCATFLSVTYRHRSALFVTTTTVVGNKEEVRKKGMEFVTRCWTLIRDSQGIRADFGADKWKATISVLKIVEKERLFVAHPIRGTHEDDPGEVALGEVRDKAVEVLETIHSPSKDHGGGPVIFSIQLLDVLAQIEYDFAGSVLERVLSVLINLPPIIAMSSEFFTRVLEYHTKTRTVHTYALALLSALASSSTPPTSCASSFPLAHHLPALARALRTSLTPSQTVPLATAVLQAVENAWQAFQNVDEEETESVKKRKVTEDTNESSYEAKNMPVQARVFSHTGRVAGMILSNLPSNAYARNEEYSLEHIWDDVGKLGWSIIRSCLEERTKKEHDTMKSKDGKKRKHAVEKGPFSVTCSHIVTSGALRFLYDVRARVSCPLGDCDHPGKMQVERLLNIAQDKASNPELVFETIRTLLWHVWYTHRFESQKQMEPEPIFTTILDIITARPLSDLRWSGTSTALTRDNLGLAVLYVLTERWIDLLDSLSSTETLERLLSALFVSFDLFDQDLRDNPEEVNREQGHAAITLRDIILGFLRNAQFWELHKVRGVFLSSVLTWTAPLSAYCFSAAKLKSPSSITSIAQAELAPVCNVYGLLQYVPPEYFTRSVRNELVKRAIAADVQICAMLEGAKGGRTKIKRPDPDRNGSFGGLDDGLPEEESQRWSHRLTFVRVFLQRMGQFLSTPSHSTSSTFIVHLLSPPSSLSPSNALTKITLDLIQLYALSLLRSQEPEAATSISEVISAFVIARPFSRPKSQEMWTQLIVQSSVLRLIEHATSDFNAPSLPDQVQGALRTLFGVLESALFSRVESLTESDAKELGQSPSSEQITAWSRMLSLRRWLGMNSQVAAVSFGLKLVSSVTRNENSARLASETCSSILGLLFEELWCSPDTSRRVHLDMIVTFYTVNGGGRGSDTERIMDTYVAQASKRTSVEDFSRWLNVLEEAIGGRGHRPGHWERLIHLGQVVLHDAPQGTLKVIQHFATECFNMFADREEIYRGPPTLKVQCLELIARHCSDRPAAIRAIDLSSIWSLLNKLLSGSSEHDPTTAFPIFHHTITIIGALIRLRRDLIVHTLPHLCLALHQLMMLTRKIRPQLGAKQSKIVMDTFPSWLSASQPLSTDEARALARLLVSLTTKTVPRVHTYAASESQKAESLAKPFSKHASYVLVAYVDAFNDPLCILSAEMRRDLEPGLFALCGMVGEHSRDALMVSTLDSGGKTIMKSLWKEYEKQRYMGKG